MQKHELLLQLKDMTNKHLVSISKFKQQSESRNNKQINKKSWSVNQCIEHLSRYADYYLPALEFALEKAKPIDNAAEYKGGWLGNYFAESMLPESPKSKHMTTFKSMNPFDGNIRPNVIDKFENQILTLIKLLEDSEHKSLNSPRIATTISQFIKLKPGDTFRFLINHNERHIQQALNVLRSLDEDLSN